MAHRHRPIRRPVSKIALSTLAAGAMVVGGTGVAQACDNGSSQASGTSEAGTVQSVNGAVITLLDRSGNTDTVDTDNNTMFETESGAPASPSGVADGDFLWAFGSMQSDGSLLAAKVKYGPANQVSSFQSRSSSQSQQSSSTNSSGDDDGPRRVRSTSWLTTRTWPTGSES